jgi:hypothetical protein
LQWIEGFEVIRQAISCDICATEKRQTNHWFVAYEQGGELRVSGWSSRHKLRPGSKHLCGQTCLHKLVDEFMAKSIAVRAHRHVEEADPEPPAVSDASLTSSAAYPRPANIDPESSARIITPPAIAPPPPVLSKPVYRPQPEPVFRPQPELVTTPPRPHADYTPTVEETPRYASRNWRAEAWERERERELRAIGNRPDIAARRASNA